MQLELIKNIASSKVARQLLLAKKNSPGVMFYGGLFGFGTTVVLACKATLNLEERLDEVMAESIARERVGPKELEKNAARHKVETARGIAKLYFPAVAVGVVSVSMLTGSHVTLTKRNAAVVAAYSALDRGFNEYRDRVRTELGEEKELHLRHGTQTVSEQKVGKDGKPKTVESIVPHGTPSVYARFFDEFSSHYTREPEYNQIYLNCQQNYANDRLRARGHVFLNEIYDMLGLPRSKAGAVVGWVMSKNGDNFIDFGIYSGSDERTRSFVNGAERSILLDFNVDGVIYDLI
jgi:hypothetical protein